MDYVVYARNVIGKETTVVIKDATSEDDAECRAYEEHPFITAIVDIVAES